MYRFSPGEERCESRKSVNERRNAGLVDGRAGGCVDVHVFR